MHDADSPELNQTNGLKVKVGLTDSWVTLATAAGLGPSDLIRYNYPDVPADLQEAAREVNWYLQEYVGCTKVTSDGRNYVFAGANPGEAWVPNGPSAVPLTRDQIARKHSTVSVARTGGAADGFRRRAAVRAGSPR